MEIPDIFFIILNAAVFGINFVGIIVVFWGFVVAAMAFVRMKLHRQSTMFFLKEANEIRAVLGTYILFGLEFMIAGDIIHTFIKPNQEDLIVLGAIVAIRTVISYFLGREVEDARREREGEQALNKQVMSGITN
ncbi:MAG: DUF1622 domain-containing protein [Alphaproteobacteria bacterium]|jgi:uncharacterized membrane protein|nr:DUF1622 domain-containing protein [Alphaproteobacteria bacterium]MBP9776940.1 DUF1622 domain-containing protein [Alphaproteobacteria bacterium]